ncbi:NHL repeat containing 3 [Phyllostomus discolor]|uniref:NHL repeat containing 3 n=1 Tax=Phyllostomus discolor TaxID=89673 RepID=A0A834DLT5_9CHIR|nr:NHL repeat containing 3 [Phyllostomus discolor]
MARVWLCAGGAGCLLAFLVLHSHLSGSPVLRDFVFQISWRTEDVLYRLDVGWPKHPEYFAGATFCVAVDSPNGLVYVAQVSKTGFLKRCVNTKEASACCAALSSRVFLHHANYGICFLELLSSEFMTLHLIHRNYC